MMLGGAGGKRYQRGGVVGSEEGNSHECREGGRVGKDIKEKRSLHSSYKHPHTFSK